MKQSEKKVSSRGLSQKFMNDLKLESGALYPILQRVLEDRTLDLEIRDNYINVYYRGGNLINIAERSNDYLGTFNTQYMKHDKPRNESLSWVDLFPYSLKTSSEARELVDDLFPFMKVGMNQTLAKSEKCEREFQQLVARENNYSPISSDVDYIICDIEYTHTTHRELRFDLIAAHWPSKRPVRKKPNSMKLALIEMKYRDESLTGSAGIRKHYTDLTNASKHISILCDEMTVVTKQKSELGLIKKGKLDANEPTRIEKIKVSASEKPEWILLLANHDPEKSALRKELIWLQNKSKEDNFPFEIKIAVSNFMGYGLYEDSMIPLSKFLEEFLPE